MFLLECSSEIPIFIVFLVGVGIGPNKSRTIKQVLVPSKYFFDFVRGVYDGDGSSYSYWDKRWRSSFVFYVELASASKDFICWLRKNILKMSGISGHTTGGGKIFTHQLKYAKRESIILLKRMYRPGVVCLSRKRLKNENILGNIGKRL